MLQVKDQTSNPQHWHSGKPVSRQEKAALMAKSIIPHLCNDRGVDKIYVGVKEFQCMGASPPLDHPHIFLDMGADSQIICPYCSTLYIFDERLESDQTDPPESIHHDDAETV